MLEITNIDKLGESLRSAQNILVVVGERYSIDELAAALTLGLSLEKSGKKITIFSPKPPLVGEASLFGISRVTNKLTSGNLVIAIPDALDSVDKVTHYLEGETLNIVVHPVIEGAKLSAEKVMIMAQENAPDLAIFVNTTTEQFLNNFNTQDQKNYANVKKFVVGKTFNNAEGEIGLTPIGNPCFSETILWILNKLGLPLDADCASNLFQGMQFATNFTPPAASASTFEAASICLQEKPVFPFAEVASENDLFQQGITGSPSLGNPKIPEEVTPSTGDDNKIQSDWLVPKIFKSSAKNLDKT